MPLDIPVLDAAETTARLRDIAPEKLLESLKTAFAGLTSGASVQPATAVVDYPDGEGDCVFLSGMLWDLDLLGVKVSPLSNHRKQKSLHPVTAYTLLVSARSGEPMMLCDAMSLTSARTGATTALGVDYLAGSDASTLFVFGAGQVAVEHVRHVARLRTWTSVRMFSPSLVDPSSSRSESFRLVKNELEALTQCEVSVASDAAAAKEADVVMCCTSANYPVIGIDDVKPGALVTSVSSDITPAHEIAPVDIPRFDVFCDYKPTAIVKSWELKSAVSDHGWSFGDIVGDLPELIAGEVSVSPTARKYFRNHGLAIEDLVVAGLIA